jgi:hypothetical protein
MTAAKCRQDGRSPRRLTSGPHRHSRPHLAREAHAKRAAAGVGRRPLRRGNVTPAEKKGAASEQRFTRRNIATGVPG